MTERKATLRSLYPPPNREDTGKPDPLNELLEQRLAEETGANMPSMVRRTMLEKIYEEERFKIAQIQHARASLDSGVIPQQAGETVKESLGESVINTLVKGSIDAITTQNSELRQSVKDLVELIKNPSTVNKPATESPQAARPLSPVEVMKEEIDLFNDVIKIATDSGLVVKPGATTAAPAGIDPIRWMQHEKELMEMKFNQQMALHKLSREETQRDNELRVELAKVTGKRLLVKDIKNAVDGLATTIGSAAARNLRKNKGGGDGEGSMQECPECHQRSVFIPRGFNQGLVSCTNPACGTQFNPKTEK